MSLVPQNEFQFYGFDPRSIAGCALWLDATDSNSFTFSSGTSISTWKDRSSNALTGTASGSPTRVSPDIDGLPFVNFNSASSQYFNFGNNLNLGTNSIHIFAVAQIATNTPSANIISKSRSAALAGRWALIRDASSTSMLIAPTGTTDVRATQSSDSHANVRLLTGYWNRSNLFLLQNGTQVGTNTSSTTTNYSTTDLLYVGAYQTSAGNAPVAGFYMNGKIGEIIVYIGGALSTAQRQQVEGYLAWKWRLNTFFSNVHPYKFYPPVMRPFQPVDLDTQCILWLDAQDTTSASMTFSSGTTLSAWKDKSGFGSDFNAFSSPVTGTVSNRAVIDTTGNGYFSNASTFTFPATYSTFSVGYTTITATWAGMLYATPDAVFMLRTSSPGIMNVFKGNRSIWGNTSGASTSGTVHSIWTTINPTAAGTLNFYTDGSLNVQTVTGVTNSTGTGMVIGYWSTTSYPWKGYYGDVIFYNAGLSSNDRQQVEGYLGWKYNLVAKMPNYHAFKYFPPLTTVFNPLHISGCGLWLDAADSNTVLAGISSLSTYVPASPTTSNLTNTGNTPAGLSSLMKFGTCTMGGSFINGVPRAGWLAPSATSGVWYACTQDVGYCKTVKLQFSYSGGTFSVTALSAGYSAVSSSNFLLQTNDGATNDSYYAAYTSTTVATSAAGSGYGVATLSINYSGTNVYQWTDKSTVGRNYTQATAANTPSYASQTISFASPQQLSNASTWTTNVNYDIFVVGKPYGSGTITNRVLLASTNSLATGDAYIAVLGSSTSFGWSQYPTPTFRQYGTLTIDGNSKVVMYVNLSSARALSAALNGTLAVSTAAGTATATTTPFQFLGCANNLTQWGDVNELIIYQGTLTRQQRQRVEGYLAQKWGISMTNFPGNHAYAKIRA